MPVEFSIGATRDECDSYHGKKQQKPTTIKSKIQPKSNVNDVIDLSHSRIDIFNRYHWLQLKIGFLTGILVQPLWAKANQCGFFLDYVAFIKYKSIVNSDNKGKIENIFFSFSCLLYALFFSSSRVSQSKSSDFLVLILFLSFFQYIHIEWRKCLV